MRPIDLAWELLKAPTLPMNAPPSPMRPEMGHENLTSDVPFEGTGTTEDVVSEPDVCCEEVRETMTQVLQDEEFNHIQDIDEWRDRIQTADCDELEAIDSGVFDGRYFQECRMGMGDMGLGENPMKYAGEPMDITMRLLKEHDERHPDFEKWADEVRANPEYEDITEDWTADDHRMINQATSREDFYKRLLHIAAHYQNNPFPYGSFPYESMPTHFDDSHPDYERLKEQWTGDVWNPMGGERPDWWEPQSWETYMDEMKVAMQRGEGGIYPYVPNKAWQQKNASEPMDITMRLLKMDPEESAYHTERTKKMNELAAQYAQRMVEEGTPEKGRSYPNQMADGSSVPRGGVQRAFGHLPRNAPELQEYREWRMSHPYVIEQNRQWSNEFDMGSHKNPETGRYRMMPRSEIFEIRHPGIMGSQEMPTLKDPYGPYVEWVEGQTLPEVEPVDYSKKWKEHWEKGEPMDIAFRLLKDRKSPEAFRHKKEYDTKYESSPERVKYREDLNRERRRRGMYGDRSHRDISHTEGGKLTVESEHANRARHFKNKGTLRVV